MTETCEQPGCAMRAGHAGDWHAGELENAVIAMPRPEPQDLEEALVWLSAASGQRQGWQQRALKAEEDRARLVAMLKDVYEDQGLADWLEGEDDDYGDFELKRRKLVQRIKAELEEGTDG